MGRVCLVLALCASLMTPGLFPCLCVAAPSAEELERNAITYRLEKTKCGYVRMHVVNEVGPQQTELLYDVTYDGKRARQIQRSRLLGKSEWGKPEKTVVTPKIYIEDVEFIGGDSSSIPVRVVPLSDRKDSAEHLRVLNVQALGMDLEGADMLHQTTVETLLYRSDRTNPTVHPDRLGELEAWRLDYRQKPSNFAFSVWIAPSQGYSIVRAQCQADQKDGNRLVQTTESPSKQYPVAGIWYPHTVTKTVTLGGRVVRRQVVTVEEAHFGGVIDEAAFTIGGLDLNPGRQVTDSTSGQPWAKVWDGKDIVDPSSVEIAAPSKSDRRVFLLVVLSIGLALLAIVYFWRMFLRKRTASDS